MKKLLIALKEGVLDQQQLARVRELAPGHEVLVTRDRDLIRGLLPDIEIALGNFPRDLLAEATALKWYQQWGAGADWLLERPDVAAMDFILTNTSGIHAIPIAEHVLAFMLAFARGFPEAFRNQSAAQWPRRPPEVLELAGKELLLVGVGRIGEHTARLAKALGMTVSGVRRSKRELPAGFDRQGDLHELLPGADFVVLTVPLTSETRNMIAATELSQMKESAFIINIGRGGTIDEAALLAALQEGRIAGAGLDVFEEEPLPPESPLWSQPNVIATSHYSGDTPHYAERALEIFMDNLARFQAGGQLRNVVDKQAGY